MKGVATASAAEANKENMMGKRKLFRVAATAARSAQLDRAKAREVWSKLLKQYGDTCLAPRIREWLD